MAKRERTERGSYRRRQSKPPALPSISAPSEPPPAGSDQARAEQGSTASSSSSSPAADPPKPAGKVPPFITDYALDALGLVEAFAVQRVFKVAPSEAAKMHITREQREADIGDGTTLRAGVQSFLDEQFGSYFAESGPVSKHGMLLLALVGCGMANFSTIDRTKRQNAIDTVAVPEPAAAPAPTPAPPAPPGEVAPLIDVDDDFPTVQ